MAIVASGKAAVTRYECANAFGDCTLLACRLETGRTHQIRVHLTSLGHPLVGDPTYGKQTRHRVRPAGAPRLAPRSDPSVDEETGAVGIAAAIRLRRRCLRLAPARRFRCAADAALAAQFVSAGVDWIVPDWPAPASVRAFSTTRNGVGGQRRRLRARPRCRGTRATEELPARVSRCGSRRRIGTAIASADVGHGRAPEADVAVSRCRRQRLRGAVGATVCRCSSPTGAAASSPPRMRDGADSPPACLEAAVGVDADRARERARMAWTGDRAERIRSGPRRPRCILCDRDAAAWHLLRRDASKANGMPISTGSRDCALGRAGVGARRSAAAAAARLHRTRRVSTRIAAAVPTAPRGWRR